MQPYTLTSGSSTVTNDPAQIIDYLTKQNQELSSQVSALTQTVSTLSQSIARSAAADPVYGPDAIRGRHYRLICYQCKEPIEVLQSEVNVQEGVGKGFDYDGGYDSGYGTTSLKCKKCGETLSWSKSLEQLSKKDGPIQIKY